MARRFAPSHFMLLRAIAQNPSFEVEVLRTPHLEKGKVKVIINDGDEAELDMVMKKTTKAEKMFSGVGKFGVMSAAVETTAFVTGFAFSCYKNGVPVTLAAVTGKLDPVSTPTSLASLESKINRIIKNMEEKEGAGEAKEEANGGVKDEVGVEGDDA